MTENTGEHMEIDFSDRNFEEYTWECDLANGVVTFNQGWQKRLGYSTEEVKPGIDGWKNLIHPDDRERTIKSLTDYLEGRSERYEAIYRMKTKDERDVWVLSSGKALRTDKSGKISRVGGIQRLISDIEMVELNLRERKKELEFFFTFSKLIDDCGDSLEKICTGLTELLPKAFFDSEHTGVEIVYRDGVYSPKNLLKDSRVIRKPIRREGEEIGSISVYYSGYRDVRFLNEEDRVVSSIAERLGKIATRIENSKALKESEELFRVTLASVGDAVLATDAFGIVTFVNGTACEMIGLEMQKILGRHVNSVMNIFNELTGEPAEIPVDRVLSSGKKVGLANHTCLKSENGRIYFIADAASPIVMENGEIVGVVMNFRDVTSEKERERRVLESEEKFRHLIENMIGGMIILYSDDGMTFKIRDIKSGISGLHFDRESLEGKDIEEVLPAISSTPLLAAIESVWESGKPLSLDPVYYDDGVLEGWWENYIYRLPSGDVVTLNYDVTERKELEEFQKLSHGSLVELSKSVASANFDLQSFMEKAVETVGRMLRVNRAGIYMLNEDSEFDIRLLYEASTGIISSNVERAMDQKLAEKYLSHIKDRRVLSIENVLEENIEDLFIRSLIDVQVYGILDIPLRIKGEIIGSLYCDTRAPRSWLYEERSFAASVGDILTMALEEDRLVRSEIRYRNMFEASSAMMVLIDPDSGRIIDANPVACGFYGYGREEMRQHYISHLGFGDLEMMRDLKSGRSRRFTTRHFLAGGEMRDLEIFVGPVEIDGKILLNCIVSDITDRVNAENKVRETMLELEGSLKDTVMLISKIVEARDPYTAGHQANVSRLAGEIAEKMKLEKKRVQWVKTAGMLHDIGKVSIPAEILSKPGKLNELEWSLMKNHPLLGREILSEVHLGGPISEIVLQHHEKMNGSGYPNGLKGEEILLEARIIAVADVIEAMSSHRPYRASRGLEEAIREIVMNCGDLYDPAVVKACIQILESGFNLSGK
jgi:PAS domain S-box-containing protein/putative nucleotidyltransferase with HDIG domain